jgi:hypothetical protein
MRSVVADTRLADTIERLAASHPRAKASLAPKSGPFGSASRLGKVGRPSRVSPPIAPRPRTRAFDSTLNARSFATPVSRASVDPARSTADAAAFLRANYDVVVEALDAVEPARTLVARLSGAARRW